jgi:hypothetical protein
VGAAEPALEPSYRELGRSVDDFALFRKDDDKGVTEEGLENKIVFRGDVWQVCADLGKLVLHF